MQVAGKKPELEAIEKVFRDLGLEDDEARRRFQQFTKPSGWHRWSNRLDQPNDTRDNTAQDSEVGHA